MALAQGFALDAVLCMGLLVPVMLDISRWTETYWIIVSAGVGKSVLGGLSAWVKCRAVRAPVDTPTP